MTLIALIALALAASTAFSQPSQETRIATCDAKAVAWHVHRAHALFQKAYDTGFDMPDTALIHKAQAHKLCVRISSVRDQLAHYRAELKRAWYEHVDQFIGPDGRRWAIPWSPEVSCESGGNYQAGYAGAYGLTSPAWNEGGGPELSGSSTAGGASPIHQDIVAARIWAAHGSSAWVPFEGGCVR